MSKHLRKTLGSATDPGMIALKNQIDTQSAHTIASWCVRYAAGHYLPLYERHASAAGIPAEDVARMEQILMVVDGHIEGMLSAEQAKTAIAASRRIAQATLFSPVAQAAVRACSCAAATAFSLSTSLGMAGYGAAAVAYDEAGLDAPAATYDELAQAEFARMLEALVEDSVEFEPNPAHIDWGC